MPVHDWTRVIAGTFHHFHHEWISCISRALKSGLLPSEYYAMAEQITGGLERQAFIEPVAVGQPSPDMPLFLRPPRHVMVPLEATYQAAFAGVPARWRREL